MQASKPHDSSASFILPEWETSARHRGEFSEPPFRELGIRAKLSSYVKDISWSKVRFDGVHKRAACSIVTIVALTLLALLLGLAIGLPLRNRSQHRSLPLGSQVFTGDLTYYGTGLGACGVTSTDSDMIVSISHFTFDALSRGANPNANPLCRHKLRATRDGNSVDLTVVDRCVGCKATDIDVSLAAFRHLADENLGRVTVSWAWLPPVPSAA